MSTAYHTFQTILITLVAISLALVAWRRREWRGGLLAMAFIFLGIAFNEFEWLTDRLPPLNMPEPELIPIATSLALAFACFLISPGSTSAAFYEVWRNRRFTLLVWGLLLVSILANAIRAKELWAFLAPDLTDSWQVRYFAQQLTKFFGHILLLNWAILFFMDEWHCLVHRPSPHEHLLREHPLIEIGQGARRICYRIGNTNYCVKFLRDPSATDLADKRFYRRLGRRFRIMLLRGRFDRTQNLNCQEAEAMVQCRLTAGAEVAAAFPETIEIVFDEKRGYGILMNLLTNADGSPIIRADNAMWERKDPAFNAAVYPKLKSLLYALIDASAPFFEPANVQVQIQADGSPRLRLIDFEPVDKKFIHISEKLPFVRRADLARRTEKFLKGLRERFNL